MSSKYKIRDNEAVYFVTYSVVGWIDVFIRNEYKEVLLDSWRFCMQRKGLEVYAWVIMSSHVHMIVGSHGEPRGGILRDMKAFTSKTIHDILLDSPTESRKEWMLPMLQKTGRLNPNNHDFQLWQQGSHPLQLMSADMAKQKLDYIHQNPVAAGIVAEDHHYVYSSAANYAGQKGLIDIIHLF